jgi:uncharacterized protein
MDSFSNYLNDLLNNNRSQFSGFSGITWLNSMKAHGAQIKKEKLLNNLKESMLFKDTKPFYRKISNGCQLCGQGLWSCLFITNKCNASCFYCPSAQLNDEIPATQSLNFETAESYADYINHFGFMGVSFSGGEPLLFFERTLHYLKTIRKMCSPDIYVWMYTNGILATEEKFRLLAEAGLNEVRFDIGATGYRLDKVKLAKGIIPNITIEIPAVPEKRAKLKQLLHEMAEAGVTNLNLHQLRLTKHNAPKLLKHPYTYIPAEQPVVLESELAALELLEYAQKQELPTGINYCSFWFKNRYQAAGFRQRLAYTMNKDESNVTERGFIRTRDENTIGYKALAVSHKNAGEGTEVNLPNLKCYINTETAMKKQAVDPALKTQLEEILNGEPAKIPENPFLFRIWQMEYIEKGLRDY